MGNTMSNYWRFWTNNLPYEGQYFKVDEKQFPKSLEQAPTEPQLAIESSSALSALATGLQYYCADENSAFMKCKSDNANPEACIKEAFDCRRCTFALGNEYSTQCPREFSFFVACLSKNDNRFKKCYQQRRILEACVSEKIGIEFVRPPVKPTL